MQDHHKLLVICGLSALLTACGGGSDSTDPTQPTPTSTQSSASGTITGFGSVFVNGVEWETDGAAIEVDDDIGGESDLKVGHIVVVHGAISSDGTASASSIEYDAELEGPITDIDLAAGTITVLAQTVVISDDTIFHDALAGTSIANLAVGNFVEVNGYPASDGLLHATRIEIEVDSGEVEVDGVVSNLDTTNSTFNLNSLVVDYAVAVFEDYGSAVITDGDHVEVEGSRFGPNGELIADSVEYEDDNHYDDGDEFEIEGIITALNADGSIEIAGMTVMVGPSVSFEHGGLSDLLVDVKVEVEGDVDASGNLVATEIEFKHASSIEVEAPLQSIDLASGSLTVLGIVFNTADTTQFEDDSDLDVPFFDLADLMMGDWVEVKAFVDEATGALIATRVERDDAEDEVELEGPVDSANLGTGEVVILGVTVTTDAMTQLDEDSAFASVADLLAAIVPGTTMVEVDGIQTDTAAITASEIEIED